MTLHEVVEIGRTKLVEYEPLLKERVKGIKPYDTGYSISSQQCYKGQSTPDADQIEQMIDAVLKPLAGCGKSNSVGQIRLLEIFS